MCPLRSNSSMPWIPNGSSRLFERRSFRNLSSVPIQTSPPCLSASCRPTSRGHIRLRSPDPEAHPAITANAYSTNADIEEMLAAGKILRQIMAQPAIAPLVKEELRPGPDVVTDEAMIDDIRSRSGTVYHPSCTCRMGPDPASSVVDRGLKVHGVGALRVIDTSAFPNITSGNTNAPAMLMGWMGAEAVLRDAR
ncbi:MAG: hypothetical protein B7Z10_08025 [Rhodobacterales bacterium 32-66-7]|nr:MAG: hypothetical protein B7Z10_08025 [Rhodobacterales bacterium 32-66-7]